MNFNIYIFKLFNYLYKYEEIPFEPPSLMPEFLFPRIEGHRNTIDNIDYIFYPQRFENYVLLIIIYLIYFIYKIFKIFLSNN